MTENVQHLARDDDPTMTACGVRFPPPPPPGSPLTFCPDCHRLAALGPPKSQAYPLIAVPEDFSGTEAEAVGLAVAGAVAGLQRERDQAREMAMALEQDLHRALSTIRVLTDNWPESTWAADSLVEAQARETLAALEDPDARP